MKNSWNLHSMTKNHQKSNKQLHLSIGAQIVFLFKKVKKIFFSLILHASRTSYLLLFWTMGRRAWFFHENPKKSSIKHQIGRWHPNRSNNQQIALFSQWSQNHFFDEKVKKMKKNHNITMHPKSIKIATKSFIWAHPQWQIFEKITFLFKKRKKTLWMYICSQIKNVVQIKLFVGQMAFPVFARVEKPWL